MVRYHELTQWPEYQHYIYQLYNGILVGPDNGYNNIHLVFTKFYIIIIDIVDCSKKTASTGIQFCLS